MGRLNARKIYYKFNNRTLEYERVFLSGKERLLVILRNLCFGIFSGIIMFLIFILFFKSPMEMSLKKENKLIKIHYQMLSKELDHMHNALEDMQLRDEKLYRAIFNADSIPMAIRKAGFGGSNRYDHLKGISNAELIIETTKKIDILKKQLYVQSNSMDELIALGKDMENKLRCIPAIQPVSNKELKRMASGYGMRIDPFYHIPEFHKGMDFSADIGTEIYATGDGTVIYADRKQGYGNCVIIDHGYDFKTLYGHIDKYKIKTGQKVKRGEVIALVGNTGKSKAPHLHYEVIHKGNHVNPANYYYQDLTPEEYDRMIEIAETSGHVMD
ncbi:MAG: M23 family metallopeptidase [Tannerella sp.]|jgi:murein DD-endopeptidase MepM/ murein hydrolase activator NlpD|nr:M23 family metallopeptidase [Tannerella sp.]